MVFAGRDITGWRPNRIASLGIGRTFQTIRLFGNMTALENVLVGMNCRLRASGSGPLCGLRGCVREEQRARQKAHELLDYVGLHPPGRASGEKSALWRPAPAGNCPRPGYCAKAVAVG